MGMNFNKAQKVAQKITKKVIEPATFHMPDGTPLRQKSIGAGWGGEAPVKKIIKKK